MNREPKVALKNRTRGTVPKSRSFHDFLPGRGPAYVDCSRTPQLLNKEQRRVNSSRPFPKMFQHFLRIVSIVLQPLENPWPHGRKFHMAPFQLIIESFIFWPSSLVDGIPHCRYNYCVVIEPITTQTFEYG